MGSRREKQPRPTPKATRRVVGAKRIKDMPKVDGVKPNPEEADCALSAMQRLNCVLYWDCLSVSAYIDWQRFTCENCEVRSVKKETVEFRRDNS